MDPRRPRAPRGGPRRTAPALLALLLAASVGTSGCGGGRDLTIIVVSLDTTRPDHLTPYGYDRDTTPTLARLAGEGVLFRNARSTSSWTLPAHMSLFTGQPVPVHEVVIDFQVLSPTWRTMGEIFLDADFRTMGFFTGPYVHGHFGFARGMEYYERCINPTVWELPPAKRQAALTRLEMESHRQVTSSDAVRRAVKTLVNRGRQRNLVFLHLFDPHYDYLAPRPYAARFVDPLYAGPIDGRNVFREAIVSGEVAPADLDQLRALYDAELAWVDDNLKSLIDNLEHHGLLDSTLIVVVSDHGEEFKEDGRFGHRFGLRDEVLRVPLILWGPGLVPEHRVVDDDVSLADVLPTLMDYADLPPDPGIWGRSLRPLAEGRTLPPRPVGAQLHFMPAAASSDPADLPRHMTLHESVVHEGMKYIRKVRLPWSPERQTDLSGAPMLDTLQEFVYDLRADPGERRNLVGSGDPRVASLRELWAEENRRMADARRAAGGGSAPSNVAAELDVIELLKATGYVPAGDAEPR